MSDSSKEGYGSKRAILSMIMMMKNKEEWEVKIMVLRCEVV
jgi:hypothetical protein